MSFIIGRVCVICGHRTKSVADCGIDYCDKRAMPSSTPVGIAIHDHCDYEDDHGICTTVGCMAEPVRHELPAATAATEGGLMA